MDIVVANSGSNSIAIFLGYGKFSFTNPIAYQAGSEPISIVTCDFNNDDRLDIVVAHHKAESISVFLGLGNGFFRSHII